MKRKKQTTVIRAGQRLTIALMVLLFSALFLLVVVIGQSRDIRQNAFSPYPTPTITQTPNPYCYVPKPDGSVKRLNIRECGCDIPGYEKKMCVGNNTMILRAGICDSVCHPIKPGATCDELGDPDPECVGKKEKDACGALKGFTCEIMNNNPPAYCGCVMNMN